MSGKWTLKKVADIADVVGGGTPSSKNEDYYGGNIAWITPKDLSNYGRRRISRGERSITAAGLKNSSAKLLPIGTVLFTSRAPIGYVAIAEKELSTNQGFKSLVLKSGNDSDFFYYLLKHNIPLFESRATGSTFKEVSGQTVKDTELLIPGFETQTKIGKILSSLDNKIELNTQINQTLEAMAQALFKSWFVNFDPVKAKVEARANGGDDNAVRRAAIAVISGKSADELQQFEQNNPDAFAKLAETADLFPERLVESELGEIPEGWEVKTVGDVAMFSDRRVLVEQLNLENYVSTENMLPNKGGISKASSLPTTPTTPSFESGQILVSNIRPYFQKIWLATFSGGRSNDVLGFVPKAKGMSEFLFHLMYQDSFFAFMMATSKGAKMPRGDKDAIMGYQIAFDKNAAVHFSIKVKAFNELSAEHIHENKALAQTRDILLPKLLSGEIDLSSMAPELQESAK